MKKKKRKKTDTLVVIDNYHFYDIRTDRQTERQTWRLYDQPDPEGRVGEEEKNLILRKITF